MRKELALGLITVLLVATPAFAAPGGNGKADQAKDNHGSSVAQEKKVEKENTATDTTATNVTPVVSVTPSVTPEIETTTPKLQEVLGASASPTATLCDPNANWKNHGAYVSCVAKTHPGGAVVSAAAKSSVGKHEDVTPTITPSVSPTESPTPSPSATPSATPTPDTSSSLVLGMTANPFESFLKAITHFFSGLPFLHHSHH